MNILDNPLLLSMIFYPRAAEPGHSHFLNAQDGTIPVKEDIVLGYRLFPHLPAAPVVVYFHGNGEIASDYDGIAPEFQRIGASLLVIDYRGYGWSTGRPLLTALMSDVEAVQKALEGVLSAANLARGPRYLMGRSLGSIPAIYMASLYPQFFKGLMIESGFANGLQWLASKGMLPPLPDNMPDPIGNADKIKTITLPLLVIHGEHDTLIPPSNGQTLHDNSPAAHKRILRIPGAGHNDLLFYALDQYFDAIKTFIQATQSPT